MTRAMLVVALLAGTSTVAAADPIGIGGYAGLGIGPAGNVSYSAGSAEQDGRSGQVFGGIRLKGPPIASRFSAQVGLALNSFVVNSGIFYDARMVSLAGRYSHPLGFGMEVFGKLGIAQTTYNTTDNIHGADGTQAVIGFGAEYRLPITVKVSVLVDYTIYRGDVEGDYVGKIEGGIGMWMLGFTIGM